MYDKGRSKKRNIYFIFISCLFAYTDSNTSRIIQALWYYISQNIYIYFYMHIGMPIYININSRNRVGFVLFLLLSRLLLTNIPAVLLLLLDFVCVRFVSLHFSRFFRYIDSSDMFTFSIFATEEEKEEEGKKAHTNLTDFAMSVARLNANFRNSTSIYTIYIKTTKNCIASIFGLWILWFCLPSTFISTSSCQVFQVALCIGSVSPFGEMDFRWFNDLYRILVYLNTI